MKRQEYGTVYIDIDIDAARGEAFVRVNGEITRGQTVIVNTSAIGSDGKRSFDRIELPRDGRM